MITLVLGGSRSGKSELAERIAASCPGPVTYVATAIPGDDADFADRIGLHRARRPESWTTIEAGSGLVDALDGVDGTVLIDSLGTWVAAGANFEADVDGLCRRLTARAGSTVVVSEEVGMGVHPATALGGRFRDALGRVNRAVSAVADEAYLVVAGRPLRLEPPFEGRPQAGR